MSDIADRRLIAWREDFADIRLEGQVPARRFVAGRPMRVADAVAPLRREPRPDSAQETEALFGEDVEVFDVTEDGWACVQLCRDAYVGWMGASALDIRRAPATHIVSVPRTLLFPGPDIKLPPLAGLPMGAAVSVTASAEDRNAAYAVVAPAGAVVAQHLDPIETAAPDFAGTAERFLGVPYLWGGKTTLGIDCSGLVQVALGRAGIAAPRDTDMQEGGLGSALATGATLLRGDLVFWRGHVGIMLDAERLLHANAFHMMVATEPLAETVARAAAKGSPVSSIRRIA